MQPTMLATRSGTIVCISKVATRKMIVSPLVRERHDFQSCHTS